MLWQAKKSRQEDEASAKDDHHGPSAEPCNQFSTCLKPVHAEVPTKSWEPSLLASYSSGAHGGLCAWHGVAQRPLRRPHDLRRALSAQGRAGLG
jgi:hypothetical protein